MFNLQNPYDPVNTPLPEYRGSSGFLMPFPVSPAYVHNTYSQDGIPLPYEQLQNVIQGGEFGGNLGFVSLLAAASTTEWGQVVHHGKSEPWVQIIYHSQFDFWGFPRPANSGQQGHGQGYLPVPLPTDLRHRVEARVNNSASDCKEYLLKLLKALSLAGQANSTDIMANFDRVQNEKGFHLDPNMEAKGVSNFKGGGRIVNIKTVSGPTDARNVGFTQDAYAGTALGEVLHQSRNSSVYTDRDLAKAVFSLLSPGEQSTHPLPRTDATDPNSAYAHPLILGHCPTPMTPSAQ
jgi:hypothetical protein